MAETQQQKGRAKAQAEKPAEDAPKEATPASTAPEPDPGPDRIPVERLMRDADAFTGYPAHVLAGALHGDDRTALTPDEARAACKAWLGVK